MKSDTRELVEDLLEYLRRYHNGADTCEDNDCDGCKLVRRAEAFNIRAIRNAEAKPATERTGEPARIAQGMLYAYCEGTNHAVLEKGEVLELMNAYAESRISAPDPPHVCHAREGIVPPQSSEPRRLDLAGSGGSTQLPEGCATDLPVASLPISEVLGDLRIERNLTAKYEARLEAAESRLLAVREYVGRELRAVNAGATFPLVDPRQLLTDIQGIVKGSAT